MQCSYESTGRQGSCQFHQDDYRQNDRIIVTVQDYDNDSVHKCPRPTTCSHTQFVYGTTVNVVRTRTVVTFCTSRIYFVSIKHAHTYTPLVQLREKRHKRTLGGSIYSGVVHAAVINGAGQLRSLSTRANRNENQAHKMIQVERKCGFEGREASDATVVVFKTKYESSNDAAVPATGIGTVQWSCHSLVCAPVGQVASPV